MKLTLIIIGLFLFNVAYSQGCTKNYNQSNWGTCEEEYDLQMQNFRNYANTYCSTGKGVDWQRTKYSREQTGVGGLVGCKFTSTIVCNCAKKGKEKEKKTKPQIPQGITNSHQALSWLLNNSNNDIVKGICNTILVHWNPQNVINSKQVGFWWHNKYFPSGFTQVMLGTDIVYCHAASNSKMHPNGPWQVEVQFQRCVVNNKADIRKEFEKVGYKCIQDDGHNTAQGDKALAFEFVEN